MKRLYRSETNKVLAGVMGGIGEYANVDPVILRAGYVALCVFTAVIPGILTYFLLALIIPRKPKGETVKTEAEKETLWDTAEKPAE